MGRFEGSSRELLRFALTAIAQFMLMSDRVVLPKIVIAEAGNFPEMVRFYRTEVIDKGLALLSRVFTRGVERGEFRPLVPRTRGTAVHRAAPARCVLAHDLRAVRQRALRL